MSNGDKQAFPCLRQRWNNTIEGFDGMTLREHYAGLVMQGLVTDRIYSENARKAAEHAVRCADALIAELAKGDRT